ncbi:MAG: serine protease [Patescibacteria group bacterium]|jgi:hypothetical protein
MRKKIQLCVFFFACLSACVARTGPETPAIDRNTEATHRVDLRPMGHGTAVVLHRSGYLLTCYHVAGQGENEPFVRISVDGAPAIDYPAKVVAWDRELDISVLKVERRFETTVVLGRIEDVHALDAVYTVGFPYDLGEMAGYGRVKSVHWSNELRDVDDELAIEFTDGQGMSGSGVYLARTGWLVGLLHVMHAGAGRDGAVTDNRQALIRVAVPVHKIRTFLDRAGIPYQSAVF